MTIVFCLKKYRENVLFNCYMILQLEGYDIDKIDEWELEEIFSLDSPCQICEHDLIKGICSYNPKHYKSLYRLIFDYIQFLEEAMLIRSIDNILNKMLNNLDCFRCGQIMKEVTSAYLKAKLKNPTHKI